MLALGGIPGDERVDLSAAGVDDRDLRPPPGEPVAPIDRDDEKVGPAIEVKIVGDGGSGAPVSGDGDIRIGSQTTFWASGTPQIPAATQIITLRHTP